MELRVLNYFLMVAREESITGAARVLHITQPALSRQLKDLEEEIGKQLLIRGKKVTLTEDGMLLRRRAEEILNLAKKTEDELRCADLNLAGDIYLGAGETPILHCVMKVAARLQSTHPDLHFHISSGDATYISDLLENGLIDFGLVFDPIDTVRLNHIELPFEDTWGLLIPKNDPLAEKEYITAEDLKSLPLIVSRRSNEMESLCPTLKIKPEELNIANTFSLLYNASIMVEEGMGYAVILDGLINCTGDCRVTFRPLSPHVNAHMYLVWKKNQVLSRAAERFINEVREDFEKCCGDKDKKKKK